MQFVALGDAGGVVRVGAGVRVNPAFGGNSQAGRLLD